MNDDKKAFLSRYRNNEALIARLAKKIERLEEQAYAMRMSDISGMPRGSNGVSNYSFIDDKQDIEARIQRLTERGKVYKKEILEKIDILEDTRYADVLELYFIECCDFADIAKRLNYSERHVRRLYARGIDAIEI